MDGLAREGFGAFGFAFPRYRYERQASYDDNAKHFFFMSEDPCMAFHGRYHICCVKAEGVVAVVPSEVTAVV